MQRRHGGDFQLECIVCPVEFLLGGVGGGLRGFGVDVVYEAVFFGHETGWCATIQCQYDEGDPVVDRNCATDSLVASTMEKSGLGMSVR